MSENEPEMEIFPASAAEQRDCARCHATIQPGDRYFIIHRSGGNMSVDRRACCLGCYARLEKEVFA